MKSFRGYLLNEVAWTESLSTMLFDLPRAGFKDIHIPLSPSIFKRIWPKPVRTKAFHLTDLVGVQKLKKMQGSKRSIAAFYNMTDYMIQSGIRTDGGYVVELEGDVLAASPDDLSTQPDKSGRRWITVSTLMNPSTASDPGLGGKSKLPGLEEDIKSLLVDIMAKNDLGPYKKTMSTNEVGLGWSYLGKSTGGKEKSLIIKDYIDGMEKIMKKHSKSLRQLFIAYTMDRTQVPDPDSGDTAMWDEIVVNNVKMKKIHVSPEFSPDFAEVIKVEKPTGGRMYGFANKDKDIYGFPFELYHETGEMVDYINRTLR
ncbi:hypothetical protein [uncultured Mediterranean phage]|nr:hypothetical protein [uncultured Mediterranean phage]|tara:strand:- start:455 stop:1393 length:939 start_codon:yes stop_codon:yes gene_type:complete